jgi:hypothetical protein
MQKVTSALGASLVPALYFLISMKEKVAGGGKNLSTKSVAYTLQTLSQ